MPGRSIEIHNNDGNEVQFKPGFDPYEFRKNRDAIPTLSDFFNTFNQNHLTKYNKVYDRPWAKNGETGLRDSIVKQYTDALAEYNQMYGTSIQPDAQALKNFEAAPTTYAANDWSAKKSSGFFDGALGKAVLLGASFMGAPYLSGFLGGGLAGAVGSGAIIGGGGAALTGGDVAKGALLGAVGGGVGYGVSGGAGAGMEGSGASAESWSDWATSGPSWTSGGDLPVGGYTGGIPAAGGDLGTLDWVSGGDLPTGDYTAGAAGSSGTSPGSAAASGAAPGATPGAAAPGAATAAGATTAGGATAPGAAGGLTGNATVDTVLKGLAAAGVPQALMGSVVSNLVANGLFGADDARKAAERYANAASGALGLNQAITMEQYNRWKQEYAPLESELVAQARRGMGNEEVDSIMGRINADATQQFGQARENLSEELRRRGIQPGSNAEILGLSELNASEAAAKNGAQTTAKENVRQFNRQFATNVASVGRGIPAQTMTGLSNQTTQNANLAATNNQLGMNQQYAAGQATAPFVRAANQWFNDNVFKTNAGIPGTGSAPAAERFGGWNNLEFGSGGYA